MIFNTAKTIYALKANIAKEIGVKYKPELNTTLNEKFDVFPNYDITTDEYPLLNLITIGSSGNNIIDSDLIKMKRARHTAKDGALFNHIPFLIVPMNTPLTEDEQKKFRLGSVQTINGVKYDCYYGLVIDNIIYDDRIFKIRITDGLSNMYPLDTNEDDKILNPTPISNLNVDQITNEMVLNSCSVKISFTKDDMDRIKDNIKFITGEENSNITEIGLCMSIEKDIKNRNNLLVKENVWTQIAYHVDVNIDLELKDDLHLDKKLEFIIDIGGMEPLSIAKG